MNKRNTIITVAVLVFATGFIFYKQILADYLAGAGERTSVTNEEAALRELSDIVKYDVPGGTHTIQFSIFVDEQGTIQRFEAVDTTDPDHQKNVDEFAMTLGPQIRGRQLSELEAFDMIGTSSLTTDAFNTALENMQTIL